MSSKPDIVVRQPAALDTTRPSRTSLSPGQDHAREDSAPATTGTAAPATRKTKTKPRKRTRGTEKSVDAAAEPVGLIADDGTTQTASGDEAKLERAERCTGVHSLLSDAGTVATNLVPGFHGRALPRVPGALYVEGASSYVEVPVLAHYELRRLPVSDDSDDDDTTDEGLFATHNIEPGTRLISERPLFTLPAPGDQVPGLMAAYANLSPADEQRVWNMRPAAAEASQVLVHLRFLTDSLAVDLQTMLCKPAGDRTGEEQVVLEEMQPKLLRAMAVYRITARWHANRCSLLEVPAHQRAHLPSGTPITGLFIERAHMRHSCVPNCFASYDAELGRINVHATRAIAAGEELTLSAFADTMYYSNAADRKVELAAWGVSCTCEACDATHARFALHEAARERAQSRAMVLTDMLTRLEKEDMVENDLNTAQNLLLDLIRDLQTSGGESVETVRWRNVLVDRILPARALAVPQTEALGAWRVMVGFARECERVGGVCYGEDRSEYRVLRRTREGVEATVGMLEEAVAGEEE